MTPLSVIVVFSAGLQIALSFRGARGARGGMLRTSAPQVVRPLALRENDEVELAPLLTQDSSDSAALPLAAATTVQESEASPSPLLTFELVAILTVYFVQGALGLSRLALSFFMKDQLHLSPADVSALGGITTLPWVIKPLYGFLSDGVPILGYRRRSYLMLAGMVGCLSWLSLGMGLAASYSTVLLATTLGSASVAMSDVVVDSIVVERSRVLPSAGKGQGEADDDSKGGDLQSMCWSAASVGGILSAYFSGSLLTTTTPQVVFLITAAFPLLVSLSGLLISEQPAGSGVGDADARFGGVRAQLDDLIKTVKNPAIYLPALFVFFWQATPSADSALFYFSTNSLGFGPEFLGQVRLVGSLASLGGVLTYRYLLKDKPIKDIIWWTTLLSVPLGLTQALLTSHVNRDLGIPDKLFALTDTVVLSVLGQIAFMPTLVLAAKLCPPGAEGTLFATLMSIFNLSHTVSSELGAGLTSMLHVTESNFDNLTLLVVLCSVSSALPLLAIGLLDSAGGAGGGGDGSDRDRNKE